MSRNKVNEFNTIRATIDAFKHFIEDRTGRPSDDLSFPNKLIYFYLRMFKNKVAINNLYKKNMYDLDASIVHTIPCVELEEVDYHEECPCAPPSGCTWFRSKEELPDMLDGKPNTVAVLKPNLGLADNGIFTYVKWEDMEDKLNGRLKGDANALLYTTRNIDNCYRLYLIKSEQLSNLKGVVVSLIPKDPLQLADFPVCGETKQDNICNPLDTEFSIEEEIRADVFEMTYNTLSRMRTLQPNSDVLNNDNDDTEAQVPK
jgi:hypothetical protein